MNIFHKKPSPYSQEETRNLHNSENIYAASGRNGLLITGRISSTHFSLLEN